MLCDLAGSEKPSKSGTDGSQLREAGRIKTSLTVLSRCLEGLRRNKDAAKNVPVPFRESKLTKMHSIKLVFQGDAGLLYNGWPGFTCGEHLPINGNV
ncbi:hypothetical protein V5799_024914 [Amblyomma americanum]|uniref:Kinesin motor domain-containing protein n=1 Tax=Amblyomma americanum TaxID=6943 RepID=A0AAQ4EB80_AMBAM